MSVDVDWLCLGSNAVRMFFTSISDCLFWGVIQGLAPEYFFVVWLFSWYAKIKVVCDDIDPVILASVKDVSACQGTFCHTPSDLLNLWPYPLSTAVIKINGAICSAGLQESYHIFSSVHLYFVSSLPLLLSEHLSSPLYYKMLIMCQQLFWLNLVLIVHGHFSDLNRIVVSHFLVLSLKSFSSIVQ